jgi:hypothetical protein
MEFRIRSDHFWKSEDLLQLYYEKVGRDWHLIDKKAQKVTKMLGMQFVTAEYDNEYEPASYISYRFETINKKKFIWARIKYGY